MFLFRNGTPSVVEYSEIDEDTAQKCKPDGTLLFNTGNICIHLFTIEFLERVCKNTKLLQKHVAKKKIPFYNKGKLMQPQQPNGYKFELFVFDVFRYSKKMVAMQVVR